MKKLTLVYYGVFLWFSIQADVSIRPGVTTGTGQHAQVLQNRELQLRSATVL